ncbi:hypothetical protein ACSRUE_21840 [Sorangium sp. KYC3313]|uniref:hypothetical protein n=1 Tax=Sorangium sp. KYC3313 TaxID=3449740 RepID=UPI003F8ACA64
MLDEAKRLLDEGRLADARDIHLTLWGLTKSASDAFRVGMLSFRLHELDTTAECQFEKTEISGSAGAAGALIRTKRRSAAIAPRRRRALP